MGILKRLPHSHYLILQLKLEADLGDVTEIYEAFFDIETHRLEKLITHTMYDGELNKIEFTRIKYDNNGLPVIITYISHGYGLTENPETGEYDEWVLNYLSEYNKMEWDGTELISFEDHKGNWWSREHLSTPNIHPISWGTLEFAYAMVWSEMCISEYGYKSQKFKNDINTLRNYYGTIRAGRVKKYGVCL